MFSARLVTIASVLVTTITISACSGVIHKRVSIDNGKGLSLGARQRTILVTQYGGKDKNRQVVCAEPSPDVFAVRAASASAALSGVFGGQPNTSAGQRAAAGLGFSSSESAATISRTQTIQLLRDGLYRLCEAYMNGAVDETQYNVALVNMDKLMTSLLAIDTMGGTAVPPIVGITSGKASGNASGTPPAPGTPPAEDEDANESAGQGQSGSIKVETAAGEGASVTISKDAFRGTLGKEAYENIKEVALAHHGVGDKLAKFIAICIGIQNRGDLNPGYPPHRDIMRNCDHYERLMANPAVLKTFLRSEYFKPYYGPEKGS